MVDLEALKARYRDAQKRYEKASVYGLALKPVNPGEDPQGKPAHVLAELAEATKELNVAGNALLRGMYEAQGLTPPPGLQTRAK